MSAKKTTLAEAIADINSRLTIARSIVSVTAQALDHGDTDLELHAADALKPAAESLDDILSELLSLRLGVQKQPESAGTGGAA
jgi:hypothetical protein